MKRARGRSAIKSVRSKKKARLRIKQQKPAKKQAPKKIANIANLTALSRAPGFIDELGTKIYNSLGVTASEILAFARGRGHNVADPISETLARDAARELVGDRVQVSPQVVFDVQIWQALFYGQRAFQQKSKSRDAHLDAHYDASGPHSDNVHVDINHDDSGSHLDAHTDLPFGSRDVGDIPRPHLDSHTDATGPHGDNHGDNHQDANTGGSHWDYHNDSHYDQDGFHTDWHGDVF